VKTGFSWWYTGKNPPANAGDLGSIPGLGGFHMPWSNKALVPQLLSLHFTVHEPRLQSLRAATTEAHVLRVCAPNKRSHCKGDLCIATKSSPTCSQLAHI